MGIQEQYVAEIRRRALGTLYLLDLVEMLMMDNGDRCDHAEFMPTIAGALGLRSDGLTEFLLSNEPEAA